MIVTLLLSRADTPPEVTMEEEAGLVKVLIEGSDANL